MFLEYLVNILRNDVLAKRQQSKAELLHPLRQAPHGNQHLPHPALWNRLIGHHHLTSAEDGHSSITMS